MALTKVNLANTVEGILPVANGGTGTSTGVAPGGSTTQVQYNNAGAFGGDSGFVYTGGNVGIGTTSPGAVLDVKGTNPQIIARGSTGVEPRIRLYSDTTVRGHISSSATYGLDINSETSMRLFTNGGAGSTTPVVIDTSGNFVVGGTAALATAANRGNITVNGVSESILALGVSAATKGYLYQGSANMNLVNAGTGVLTLENNGSERFRVGSSGQLGIAGANYGTSGQVLISGGASAAPSWGAVSVSGTAVAWVSFDSGGSIRASYNVSSIGVRGTGLWTVNFSSALADANYAMATSASPGNTMYNSGGCFCAFQYGPSQNYSAPSSSAAYIYTTQGTYTGGDARVFNPYITSCVFFR